MVAITQEEFIEWSVGISVAVVGAAALIIVALINTHRNRKQVEGLKETTTDVDKHAGQINSLEDRVQQQDKHTLNMVAAIGILVIVTTVKMINDFIARAKNGKH